jgi:hypothetical protein
MDDACLAPIEIRCALRGHRVIGDVGGDVSRGGDVPGAARRASAASSRSEPPRGRIHWPPRRSCSAAAPSSTARSSPACRLPGGLRCRRCFSAASPGSSSKWRRGRDAVAEGHAGGTRPPVTSRVLGSGADRWRPPVESDFANRPVAGVRRSRTLPPMQVTPRRVPRSSRRSRQRRPPLRQYPPYGGGIWRHVGAASGRWHRGRGPPRVVYELA